MKNIKSKMRHVAIEYFPYAAFYFNMVFFTKKVLNR